jgi:hypothetical protein
VLGVGGRMGLSTIELGASGRAWSRSRLGLQVELSRAASGSEPRYSSVQLAPSVLYAMRDRVADDWWLRPYVGAGPTLQRQSLDVVGGDPIAESTGGFQAFGGGEVTFAALPRFALSGDVGYRWVQAPVAGVDFGGVRVSVSAHWYLK